MEKKRILTTIEEVKAFSDPFRYRILNCLYKSNEAMTVKMIADELEEVPAKVHYHVKKLEKYNIVELHHTKEINGIMAKYYVITAEDFEIKCTKDVEESSKQLMLGEAQRIIGDLYDMSRDVFLKQIAKKNSEDNKGAGSVMADDVYLTEAEAQELREYLTKFYNEHKNEDISGGREKYKCFFSMIEIK